MSDITRDDYIENIETKSKVLATLFSDELRKAEETNNFSIMKHRLPLILDVISVYDDFSDQYHSQICSELIDMVARIQKGLGLNESVNADANINPAMY
ncbi:MAG TPA: hypothetical protein VIM51_13720 [Desulfosporosinus sp.]